jgi:V8-like Glu-specific endopeptidase
MLVASCLDNQLIAASPPGSAGSQVSNQTPSIIDDRPMPKLSGTVSFDADPRTRTKWCTPTPNNLLDNDVRWFKSYHHPSPVGWLKVHLTINSDDSQDGWEVIVKDKSGQQVDVLTFGVFEIDSSGGATKTGNASQTAQAPHSLEAISQRISGDSFRVELKAAVIPARLNLCVQSYEYESDTSHIEVKEVTHKKDLRTVVQPTDANYSFGRPVAALYFPSHGTKREISCTGFAVSSTLFVTNYHCISETWQLRTAFARFNYEVAPADSQFEARFSGFAISPNAALDYSILRLSAPIPDKYIARLQVEPLAVEMALILFQYPDGLRKRVAQNGCQVEFVDGAGQTKSLTDFYHSCDSSGGSSGSPVMDAQNGMVVGLHHIGTYDPDSQTYHNLAVKLQLLIDSLSGDILKEIQRYSQISPSVQP